MFDGPVRGGTRGGHAEFKWSDVSADKDREHYLGHSINAPTGRWQKNKDVHWYSRENRDSEEARREEIKKVKEAEAEALAVALGFKPAPKPGQVAQTTAEEVKPNEIEDTTADEERKREKEERRKRKEGKRALKELKRAKKLERKRLKAHRESDEERGSRYRSRTLSRSRSPPPPRREMGHIRSRSPYRTHSPNYRHRDRTSSRSRSRSPGRRRFDESNRHRDRSGRRIEPVDRGYRR